MAATTIQLNFLKYLRGDVRFMDFQVFNDHHLGSGNSWLVKKALCNFILSSERQ